MELKPDVVVVGSGAGGAAAAWRLTQKGARVLLLEAGPRFDPQVDYPLDQPGWERRGFPVKPGSQAAITYGDLGALNAADAELASWSTVAGRLVTGTQREASLAGYSHVQGLGGSTLHFVGEAHRLHPQSFTLYRDHGTGFDWPLSYADLEPYYVTCEAEIGVAGPADQGARWRSAAFPQRPHPLSPAARLLRDAGAAIGMPWQENSRAALSEPFDGRPNCNYCGNCSRGCPRGDKGSADVTFLRKAAATGLLTVRTGAQVTRLVAGRDGRITQLTYVADGVATTQETPVLVLAGGAVQTPRLLLASASADQPHGLANGSLQVGRNFLETLGWHSTGFAPGLHNSHQGLPEDAISWAFNAPDAVRGAVGGCRFGSAVQEMGFVGPIAYGSQIIDGFGAGFKAEMRARFGTAVTVGAIGATLADARSYVGLHPTGRDANGVPLPQINSVLTANSLSLLKFMRATAHRLLEAAGVTKIAEEGGAWDQFSATHVFGTCRMGADSATSVVNGEERSHDHLNLYIADGSIMPGSGGGEAPSLTIQALAVRMVDRMMA